MSAFDYYQLHCEYGAFAGKADELDEIIGKIMLAAEDDDEKPRFKAYDKLDGEYARIEVEDGFIDLEKIMSEYPNVEAAIYGGSNNYGVYEFRYSDYGSTKVFFDPLYFGGDENYEGESKKIGFLRSCRYPVSKVTLTLSSGQEISYPKKRISFNKVLDAAKNSEITMDYLIGLCCPYKAERKITTFRKKFEKAVPDISGVKEVLIYTSDLSSYVGSLESVVSELEDPSIVYMLETNVKTSSYIKLDLENSRALYEEPEELSYLDVKSGNYVSKVINTTTHYDGAIRGRGE